MDSFPRDEHTLVSFCQCGFNRLAFEFSLIEIALDRLRRHFVHGHTVALSRSLKSLEQFWLKTKKWRFAAHKIHHALYRDTI